ncbi:MAG: hypothetical protein J6T82_04180 [Bacteroidaceae bacterium]|nr:hypothetical protein [Bacteroidaceae bacterium]
MKKNFIFMLAASLMFCGTLMTMSSCSDDDFEVNELGEKIGDVWFVQYDADGTFLGQNYWHVVESYELRPDGTGVWNRFFFNDESGNPFDDLGGGSGGLGAFNFVSKVSGDIEIELINTSNAPEAERADYEPLIRQLKMVGDQIIATGANGVAITLDRASDTWEEIIKEWHTMLHGGAAAEYFNINNEDFTPENWREQEAIYIYDGQGTDVKDSKGRTGYTLVNLPWYEGDKLVNMSPDFCDDLTPENGWEWVFNRCGSRNIVNNNFFAVYNKYTGILRFFYFQPESFQAGNDHVWEVTMTDNLATSSIWPYGIPKDTKIVDKAAIGQTASSTMRQFISPWVTARSLDGFVTPNAGWWAFDVDLSNARTDGFNSKDNIRLQMRSWNAAQASFVSTMAASIDGSLSADLKLEETSRTVNSAKGFCADLKELGDLGAKLVELYAHAEDNKWGEALNNSIEFGKKFFTMSGTEFPETTIHGYEGDISGTISLGMTGSVNTEGIIQSSQPVVGVASPTFYLKDFDTQNSHLGQGTWNLKTSPVVYITNQIMDAWDGDPDYYPWGDDAWTIYPITYPIQQNEFEGAPQTGCVYFFDPTTVQVDLNPAIFPEDQIEWMEVDALPGARAANKVTGTDAMRKALGLADRHIDLKVEDFRKYEDTYWRNYWFYPFVADSEVKAEVMGDYLYGEKDDFGLKYGTCGPLEMIGNAYQSYYGRGDASYILEPQMAMPEYWNSCTLPPLEINVTVAVKMKGMENPIVYNRIYLPEMKYLDGEWETGNEQASGVYKLYDRIQKHEISQLQNGHRAIYDYNVKRVKDKVLHYLNLDKKK